MKLERAAPWLHHNMQSRWVYIYIYIYTRAVTVLDFSLPRWSSNKYRGLAVNRTTPPPPSEKKLTWSHLCKSVSADFHFMYTAHCSRSQISLIMWRDAILGERFVGRAYTHCISTSAKVHAARLSSTHWRIWFSNESKRLLLKLEKVT